MKKIIVVLDGIIAIGIVITIVLGMMKIPKTEKKPKANDSIKEINVYTDEKEYFTNHELENCDYSTKYKNTFVDSENNADIILTYDEEKLPKGIKAISYGNSPLICIMAKTDNFKNYFVDKNENGFLESETQSSEEKLSVMINFKKIIEVIINGGDFSDFGGEEKQIQIYCPKFETVDGKLFKKFVKFTVAGEGKQPTPEENSTIEKFLTSKNLIQTDVIEKISNSKNIIQENEIYILFEYQFSQFISEVPKEKASSYNGKILYPTVSINKSIFVYSGDEKLLKTFIQEEESFTNNMKHSGELARNLYYNYWRTEKYGLHTPYNKQFDYKTNGIKVFKAYD